MRERKQVFPNEFNNPLIIHEHNGNHTLYNLPEGQGYKATSEDLLHLIKGEPSAVKQEVTTLLNQCYALAGKMDVDFSAIEGFDCHSFDIDVKYEETLKNMDDDALSLEYEQLQQKYEDLCDNPKVSVEDMLLIENFKNVIKEVQENRSQSKAELDIQPSMQP